MRALRLKSSGIVWRVMSSTSKDLREEITGGTFTVSSLGMFGVRQFDAIINPPQVAILAIGAMEERPLVRDGALAVGQLATVTLSSDHRVVDGADAAGFLATLRDIVANAATGD